MSDSKKFIKEISLNYPYDSIVSLNKYEVCYLVTCLRDLVKLAHNENVNVDKLCGWYMLRLSKDYSTSVAALFYFSIKSTKLTWGHEFFSLRDGDIFVGKVYTDIYVLKREMTKDGPALTDSQFIDSLVENIIEG